ncbi:cuticle collagen 2-like [Camelus dromedarius]|uniref:cuticle collagen 2-like n=1 Tax=Camelus dromedarius TaxID=9838 RepID=UPI003119EF40
MAWITSGPGVRPPSRRAAEARALPTTRVALPGPAPWDISLEATAGAAPGSAGLRRHARVVGHPQHPRRLPRLPKRPPRWLQQPPGARAPWRRGDPASPGAWTASALEGPPSPCASAGRLAPAAGRGRSPAREKAALAEAAAAAPHDRRWPSRAAHILGITLPREGWGRAAAPHGACPGAPDRDGARGLPATGLRSPGGRATPGAARRVSAQVDRGMRECAHRAWGCTEGRGRKKDEPEVNAC